MTLTLSFLGGAGTVTGSRYVVESGESRLLFGSLHVWPCRAELQRRLKPQTLCVKLDFH
jgi:hypothetical protein